jgi:hypothetical protein
LAFVWYVRFEVTPVVGAGYRPPLADGFCRFLTAPSVQGELAIRDGTSDAEGSGTHPPTEARIAAVAHLPAEGPFAQNAPEVPASALGVGGPDLEASLPPYAVVPGVTEARPLPPLGWEDVGEQVYLPLWAEVVRQHVRVLARITVVQLPDAAKDLEGWGRRLWEQRRPGPLLRGRELFGWAGQPVFADERTQYAFERLAAALAVTLARRGWRLRVVPGAPASLDRDGFHITPGVDIPELTLARGPTEAATWRHLCTAAGIANLTLAEPGDLTRQLEWILPPNTAAFDEAVAVERERLTRRRHGRQGRAAAM